MSLPEKRKREDGSPDEKSSTELLKKLKTVHGSYFGNVRFLMVFQKLHFPEKSLEECAKFILESVSDGGCSHLLDLYIAVEACELGNVGKRQFLVSIFRMLMNTYVHYMIEHKKSEKIRCVFRDKKWDVRIIESKIDKGEHIFLSEIFEIRLVRDKDTIQYVAKLRSDIRLRAPEPQKFYFVAYNNNAYPPVILGEGSYGFAFKIMGVNGKWHIVKVFGIKKDAQDECNYLNLISFKHRSFQQVIGLQTQRDGDIQHMIVSCYQGDLVLWKLRNSSYRLDLQQFIEVFLDFLDALKILHSLEIVHCDIKATNMIISPDGLMPDGRLKMRITLIDFGISQNTGTETLVPDSLYTWCYRDHSLFMRKLLKKFSITYFNGPVGISNIWDYWASFITLLHLISHQSNNFLGFFQSKREEDQEEDARNHIFSTSIVIDLIKKIKQFIEPDKINIDLIRAIYFVLLDEKGETEFLKIFERFGIIVPNVWTYDEYLENFKKFRMGNPTGQNVKNVFKHVKCVDKQSNISGPMNKLTDLFVEILRDGSDLSILGCLTMDHIQRWLDRLKESLHELSEFSSIEFY